MQLMHLPFFSPRRKHFHRSCFFPRYSARCQSSEGSALAATLIGNPSFSFLFLCFIVWALSSAVRGNSLVAQSLRYLEAMLVRGSLPCLLLGFCLLHIHVLHILTVFAQFPTAERSVCSLRLLGISFPCTCTLTGGVDPKAAGGSV